MLQLLVELFIILNIDNMDILKELDKWLCHKVNDKNVPQEERIVYSKVLDKLEDLYLQ